MNKFFLALIRSFGLLTIILSAVLVISQIIGLFLPPLHYPPSGKIPGYHFTTISKPNLIEAIDQNDLLSFDSVREVNEKIFYSIAHGKPVKLRFEHSWVLWLLSKWKGDALRYTQNPKIILMADAAVCSQTARLIVSIAENSKVSARLVSLNGHVVSELLVDEKWIVSDPDYGIVFPFDALALSDKKNEIFVERSLTSRGFSANEINAYKSIIYNGYTYRHPVWEPHETKPELIEHWSVLISWLLPVIGIGFGFLLIVFSNKNGRKSVKCAD